MKKILLIFFLMINISNLIKSESVEVNHFLICPSVNGESGYIYDPSGYILGNNMISMGIHSYYFKVNYGFMNIVEAGLRVNLADSSDILDILETTSLNLKLKIIEEEKYFINLSAGLEEIPIFFTQNKLNDEPFRPYIAASKKFYDMSLNVGYMAKRKIGLFADVSKVINDTILAIGEFDGEHYNAGVKISLNYNFNIEIFMQNIDQMNTIKELGEFLKNYFIFGITYIQ